MKIITHYTTTSLIFLRMTKLAQPTSTPILHYTQKVRQRPSLWCLFLPLLPSSPQANLQYSSPTQKLLLVAGGVECSWPLFLPPPFLCWWLSQPPSLLFDADATVCWRSCCVSAVVVVTGNIRKCFSASTPPSPPPLPPPRFNRYQATFKKIVVGPKGDFWAEEEEGPKRCLLQMWILITLWDILYQFFKEVLFFAMSLFSDLLQLIGPNHASSAWKWQLAAMDDDGLAVVVSRFFLVSRCVVPGVKQERVMF